jgi:hypothetical protein
MVDLSKSRELSAEERVLLDFLLAGPNVRAEVRTQGDSAQVVSVCDCGCRSVGLRSDVTAFGAPDSAEDSYIGRHDYIGLTADGLSAAGTDVEVTLHIVLGRMTELEIWDGASTGGKSRGELPEIATLQYRERC